MVIAFVVGLAFGAALLHWYNRSVQKKRRRIPREWPRKEGVDLAQQGHLRSTDSRQIARHTVYGAFPQYRCDTLVPLAQWRVLHLFRLRPGRTGHWVYRCLRPPWVVDPSNLPHLIQIRTAFLGEHAARGTGNSQLESQFKGVSETLHATVGRKRHGKNSAFSQLDAAMPNNSEYAESQMVTGREQNSFVTPLDSRSGSLDRLPRE